MGNRERGSESHLDYPTYVLTPVQQSPGGNADLSRYVRAFWRGRYWVLGPALLTGLAVFVVISLQTPSFLSKATLLLQPPRFSTELKPVPLSIESYQAILESDMVFEQVRERLVAQNLLDPVSPLEQVRRMCSTELVSSREVERAGERPFVPLIHLVVNSRSPELSANTANLWAEVFLEENSRLVSEGSQGTLEFIEAQYPVAKNALKGVRSQLREQQDYYDRGENETARRWETTITDFSAETERLLAAYRKETERLRLEFLGKWKPELLKEQLGLKEKVLVSYQRELLETTLKTSSLKETMTQLQAELKDQPKVLVLSKAITDEALWQQVGGNATGLPEELDGLKLRTEEVNPLYMRLVTRLAEVKVEHDALVPRREHLQSEIENLDAETEELRGLITQKEIELYEILTDRSEGLTVLTEKRAMELEALRNKRTLELGLLERERQFVVEGLTRELDSVASTFSVLAEKYEAARLARQEVAPDVKIAARAVSPRKSLERHPVLFALVGALLAGLAAMALVVLFEVGRSVSVTPASGSEAGQLGSLRVRGQERSPETTLLKS